MKLAALLGTLTPELWQQETLCHGWRVPELVAHMTMAFRYSVPKFLIGMLAAGGSFHRMADRSARRDAARMSTAELTASMRDNTEHPWKPPGGGYQGALSHDVIHGLDFTVPLGLNRRVPGDHMRIVLSGMSPKQVKYFHVDLSDIRLVADDLDWSMGEGAELRGAAQHLLLVVCGRKLPAGLLSGEPAARFVR